MASSPEHHDFHSGATSYRHHELSDSFQGLFHTWVIQNTAVDIGEIRLENRGLSMDYGQDFLDQKSVKERQGINVF